MSRLTRQLTATIFKADLEEFASDRYEFIPKLNNAFNISISQYPSLKSYLNQPVVNLLTLEQNCAPLEKDIYNVLLQACLNDHEHGVKMLSQVYQSSVGREIAQQVYKNFFGTHHYIDFILAGNNLEDEFNVQVNLTPKKAQGLLQLLIASANK